MGLKCKEQAFNLCILPEIQIQVSESRYILYIIPT